MCFRGSCKCVECMFFYLKNISRQLSLGKKTGFTIKKGLHLVFGDITLLRIFRRGGTWVGIRLFFPPSD